MKTLLFKRSKRVLSLVCTLVTLCGAIAFSTPNVIFAASTNATDEIVQAISNDDISTYGSYHTFYQFPSGNHVGGFGFNFTVSKSCKLKFMYAAKYVNGHNGNFTYVLQRINGFPGVYIEGSSVVDGTSHAVTLSNSNLPAGNYSLMIIPNESSTTIGFNGEVYTLDY